MPIVKNIVAISMDNGSENLTLLAIPTAIAIRGGGG